VLGVVVVVVVVVVMVVMVMMRGKTLGIIPEMLKIINNMIYRSQ